MILHKEKAGRSPPCPCPSGHFHEKQVARVTGLEPATSGVTGRHSNQLSYTRSPLGERRL